jgi:hypothetical protein
MPRRKKISILEQRQWLSEYETGKGINEIARDAHRSISSVWKGIESARQEREWLSVREGILRQAYVEHHRDLVESARQIQRKARTYEERDLLFAGDVRTELLLEGLKSHIPDSPLWQDCRDWELRRDQLTGRIRRLKRSLRGAIVEGYSAQNRNISIEGFVDSVWFASGEGGDPKGLSGMEYRLEQRDQGQVLCWGAFTLSVGTVETEEEIRLKSAHREMVKEVPSWDLAKNVREAHQTWLQSRDKIEIEIEAMFLRRMLPGRCSLCPGGETSLKRHSRRKVG